MDANNLTAYSYSEGRVGYLQFNCNRVTDENVRKALLFAMDKKAMDDAAYESDEYYSIPYTFLPTNSQFYTEEGVEKYDQDVDKAKSMLKDAGVSNLKLKLGYISSEPGTVCTGTSDSGAAEGSWCRGRTCRRRRNSCF